MRARRIDRTLRVMRHASYTLLMSFPLAYYTYWYGGVII